MGINLGSTAIAGLKLGTTQVDKIYLGSTQVWGGSSPTPGGDYHGWGKVTYEKTVDGDTVVVTAEIQDETEFLTMCDTASGSGFTVDGVAGVGNLNGSYDYMPVRSIVIGDEVSAIPDNFLNSIIGAGVDNGFALELPSTATTIGNKFCYSSFIQGPLALPYVTQIGTDFLSNASVFNATLSIPSVTSIGRNFLTGCSEFNQNLTFPSTLTSMASPFMRNCNAMCSIINTGDSASFPFSTSGARNTLTTTDPDAPIYATGVTIVGTWASSFVSQFANSSSSPYRNLINGNDR